MVPPMRCGGAGCGSIRGVDLRSVRAAVRDELEAARAARLKGREGRARVCARRAAGAAAAAWLESLGQAGGENAYRALQHLAAMPEAPAEWSLAAGRLTSRVNEDFRLPHAEDPLEDASALAAALLDELEGHGRAGSGP